MIKNIKVQDDTEWAKELDEAVKASDQNYSNLAIELYEGTSKKGKKFEAVKVIIGEYETLIFPNKFELKYIKTVL